MKVVLYFQLPQRTTTPEKQAGVQDIAKKRGWHLQVIDTLPTAARMEELRVFWDPIGAIVECGGSYTEIDVSVFAPLPVVFLDRNPRTMPPDACCIYHDSVATGRAAARELLLTGCEHFAFVPFPEKRFWSEERGRGFMEALKLNGRTCTVFDVPSSGNDALAFQKRLRAFLAALPKPCAVFGANDQVAADVIATAVLEGLSIPNDIAVIGVDNFSDICEHAVCPLSSVEPDFREGGRLAALMLDELVQSGGTAVRRRGTFGPFRVEKRASTRRMAFWDKDVADAVDFIRREACAGCEAGQVLARFPCSRRFAEKRFRRAVGHSVLDEIHSVQLERVKMFLRDTNRPLKTIGDFCGFGNPNSLRKFFLRETGMTLSAWRQRHLRGQHVPSREERARNRKPGLT